MSVQLWTGDAYDKLRTIPNATIDAVITDPPYPEISRAYGRLTEQQWWALMRGVVTEVRRVLKPSGSAVFILQANQEYVGRTRPWLWEFMAWIARDWNMVQDVWWWNPAAMPTIHSRGDVGLLRPSVKACVWAGAPGCYRDQSAVMWTASDSALAAKREGRALVYSASGHHKNEVRINQRALDDGITTPFNLLPITNTNSSSSGGALGHGGATADDLCQWWVSYLTKPGDTVLDPFSGSGTIPQAADRLGRHAIGIEKDAASTEMAHARIVRDCGPMFSDTVVAS